MTDDTLLTVQGAEVPRIGFGTWQITGDAARESTRDALEIGYRLIDTARAYDNEADVGRGIAESGVDRSEIWITTKLWYEKLSPRHVRKQLEGSLSDLGTEYVDLLLIHWPNPKVDVAKPLGEMVKLRDQGKVRHLGVSNFPARELRAALDAAPLLTNQVEYHPYLDQSAMLELCRQHDMMLTAYSPLANGRLVDDPVVNEIANAHGVGVGQVAVRWLLDKPMVSVIPKAASAKNRRANLEAYGFELSDEERGRIDALARPDGRVIDPPWAPRWDEASTPP